MPWPIRIHFVDERPAGLSVRDWREVKKGANADAGRLYQKFLPGHFRAGAARKYGYAPRSKAYITAITGRKARAKAKGKAIAGPEVPLVFTGLLRLAVVEFGRIKAYPGRFTFIAPAPPYAPQRVMSSEVRDLLGLPKRGQQPPIASEATRLTDDEIRQLEDKLEQGLRIRGNVVRSRRARLIR